MLQQTEDLIQELMAEIYQLKNKVAELEQQHNNSLPNTQIVHKISRRKPRGSGSGNTIGVFGGTNNGTGVYGKSQNWIGVRGDSSSIGGYFYGGKASLWLTSGQTAIPTTGIHSRGELAATSESNDTTNLYFCTQGSNTGAGTWVRLNQPYTAGANISISPRHSDGTFTISATSNIVFLTSPVRVAASINCNGKFPLLVSDGKGHPNTTFQSIQVTGTTVPTSAKGIIGSLTSVGATSAGNLSLWAFGTPTPIINSLNIPATQNGTGLNLTTAFTVGLGLGGKVNLGYYSEIAGASCGFSIDVVAYIL